MSEEVQVTGGFRFAAVPEWIIFSEHLDAIDVRVWAALARHGDLPFPGIRRLAAILSINERTVQRAVSALEEAGALRVVRRWQRQDGSIAYSPEEGSGPTSNLYVLAAGEPLTGRGGGLGDTTPGDSGDTIPGDSGDTIPGDSDVTLKKALFIESTCNEKTLSSNVSELPERRRRKASTTASPSSAALAGAKAILNPWWERQDPKPGQPYMAAAKALEGMLRGGATADELAAFLEAEGAPVSGARLDVWRRRRVPSALSAREARHLQGAKAEALALAFFDGLPAAGA